MCGLCGVLAPERSAATRDVASMTRTLAHRGPDDTGTWTGEFSVAGDRWQIALGHTRLSILDLSELGHQPMLADDGVAIAYNGEVYNHRELRAALEREGIVFRSDCDTEVVLHAYRVWGVDAVERFIGMFAFAIWDAPRQRLVLARDRLGIKPLFYRHRDGVLSFASELGALRAHSAFVSEVSPDALETYLRFGWITGPQSIWADTFRVLPGEVCVWERGRLTKRAYWRVTDYPPQDGPLDFDAAVDTLDQKLGDAVEDRLISDVPLGAFLSGGVDSSAVVGLMAERAQGGVRTFSIGFEQDEFDEAPYAREIAAHLGTEHTELYVGRKQARDVLLELPTLYDEPFADPSAIPTVLLSRMTREHVTVALSGDGGDEIFGGYNRYAKLARLLPLLRLPRSLRRGLAALAPRQPASSLRSGLLKLRDARDAGELAESFLSAFDEESLRAACGRTRDREPSEFCRVYGRAPATSALRKAMYAEAATYMTDDVLVKVDRASMSTGLEARVPILDHRVVEFAFGLPVRHLVRGSETKAPLRALACRRVPRHLLDRPKHGFSLPIRDLLGKELEHWTERYLSHDRLAEEGLLDPEVVCATLERARGRGRAGESELWRLLCLQRWLARNCFGE